MLKWQSSVGSKRTAKTLSQLLKSLPTFQTLENSQIKQQQRHALKWLYMLFYILFIFMIDTVFKVLFLVIQRANCNCVGFQNANWEPDNRRNTFHPQNVGEIHVGSKKDNACSFLVQVFMLLCLAVGFYYSINPIIMYSGCAVVHVPLFCQ